MYVKLSFILLVYIKNKNLNVHNYEVRGEKREVRERKKEERERKIDREKEGLIKKTDRRKDRERGSIV